MQVYYLLYLLQEKVTLYSKNTNAGITQWNYLDEKKSAEVCLLI
jgi:hypothetical protein